MVRTQEVANGGFTAIPISVKKAWSLTEEMDQSLTQMSSGLLDNSVNCALKFDQMKNIGVSQKGNSIGGSASNE